ncbi:MAG: YeeE/YedE thiosulfate transporter family protein [Spirosomataceae bacterium]
MKQLFDLIREPWPWYVAGPLIGLTVPTLLLIGNKSFGISSSLRHICAACVPANIPFFKYDWKKEIWNLFFVLGIFLGGMIATHFLENPNEFELSEATITDLKALGIHDFSGLMPSDLFQIETLFSVKGLIFFVLGGFMVGFGTRYAGGCTSGHAIMGLSNLQWPSLIATGCFMVGGFASTHLLLPLIFKLF